MMMLWTKSKGMVLSRCVCCSSLLPCAFWGLRSRDLYGLRISDFGINFQFSKDVGIPVMTTRFQMVSPKWYSIGSLFQFKKGFKTFSPTLGSPVGRFHIAVGTNTYRV
jgi:hypothetical protein